jgi:hypothetical protein
MELTELEGCSQAIVPETGCLVPYIEPDTRINPPAHTKMMGYD